METHNTIPNNFCQSIYINAYYVSCTFYKEKCKIYETQLTGLTNTKYKRVNIDEKTTNILNYIKQLLESNKLENSQKEQCNIIIDKLNIEKAKDFNSDIYALKHYIFYLINYIVLQK